MFGDCHRKRSSVPRFSSSTLLLGTCQGPSSRITFPVASGQYTTRGDVRERYVSPRRWRREPRGALREVFLRPCLERREDGQPRASWSAPGSVLRGEGECAGWRRRPGPDTTDRHTPPSLPSSMEVRPRRKRGATQGRSTTSPRGRPAGAPCTLLEVGTRGAAGVPDFRYTLWTSSPSAVPVRAALRHRDSGPPRPFYSFSPLTTGPGGDPLRSTFHYSANVVVPDLSGVPQSTSPRPRATRAVWAVWALRIFVVSSDLRGTFAFLCHSFVGASEWKSGTWSRTR